MKSLVDLLAALLEESGRRSGAPVQRDVLTLRERTKHEGESFITITLPAFCRDFERSLDLGGVAPGLFLSFRKEQSGIPSFLKGFLCHVFGEDGCLLSNPSIDCIRAIRQICLFGKKVERPCSPARVQDAIDRFAQCEHEIDRLAAPDGQMYRYYKRVSAIVMRAILHTDDFRTSLVPAHGPGATQEGISGNQKWRFRRWHARLSRVGFTYTKFGRTSMTGTLPCPLHRLDDSEVWPDLVEPADEEPVRVVLVPKTLKTPRVIAIEPVCMQYAQQALSRWLVRRLENCLFTRGHVNFTDQSVNQLTALDGSRRGHLATLDLSEASDRVSLALVEGLLESVPVFRDWVLAARSTRAQLPTGEVITLSKFASMGSALTFPIESLVFFMIIVAHRVLQKGAFPTASQVLQCARDVYVYGDDLIVPADEAPAICATLESLGLKVNKHKSFWTGKFRESCGADCYDGQLVTPVYLRRDIPADRRDVSGVLSCVATANQLFEAGYPATATLLRVEVERVLGPLPRVTSEEALRVAEIASKKRPWAPFQVPHDSPAIGWVCDSETHPKRRWDRDLQRWKYRCWVPTQSRVRDPLEGFPALAKCLRLIRGSYPYSPPTGGCDPGHLERSPVRYGTALKRSWVSLNM